MGLFSRKEFASICHTTTAIVTSNIHREKIVFDENKKIDSDHPLNKEFFDRYVQKHEDEILALKQLNATPIYEDVVHMVKPTTKRRTKTTKKRKPKTTSEPEMSEDKKKEYREAAEKLDWDKRKKKAEALIKERQAEKALLSLKKMYGEMLPTSFIKNMFMSFSKSIFSTFDNSIGNLAGVFCDELAGGDRESLSRIHQRLNEELQLVIDEASAIAKKDMANEIKEYSVQKGRGEKE